MTGTIVKFRTTEEVDDVPHMDPPFILPAIDEDRCGQSVRVMLPPITLNEPWPCGAVQVWQLPAEEVLRLTGHAAPVGVRLCVCAHQVDID